MRWRLLLEEFAPTFHYKPGEANFIADALSRVPTSRTERESESNDPFVVPHTANTSNLDSYSIVLDNVPLAECFLEYPRFDQQGRHPFHFETIRDYQQNDPIVRQLPQTDAENYVLQQYGNVQLVCRRNGNDFQFRITDEMLKPLIRWYHAANMHAEGMDRLEASIRRHFFHPELRQTIREVVRSCHICQTMKRDGNRQHGELAPREAIGIPWQEIHVDTIGPWSMRINGQNVKYIALTVIDPVTNLLEISPMHSKTAAVAKRALEQCWLCRYPRPSICVHDNGSEFIGHDFQFFLTQAGIKSRPVAAHNPQSNGIIERVHSTIGLIFRSMIALKPPTTQQQATHLMEDSIAQAILASRCVSHGSLNNFSPGAITFHRDMLLDLPLVADILTLQQLRQGAIDSRLLKANQKRKPRDWRVGEQVLLANAIRPGDRLRPTYTGPYTIIRVHANGNVRLQFPNGTQDRVNIRRLKPYVQENNNLQQQQQPQLQLQQNQHNN